MSENDDIDENEILRKALDIAKSVEKVKKNKSIREWEKKRKLWDEMIENQKNEKKKAIENKEVERNNFKNNPTNKDFLNSIKIIDDELNDINDKIKELDKRKYSLEQLKSDKQKKFQDQCNHCFGLNEISSCGSRYLKCEFCDYLKTTYEQSF